MDISNMSITELKDLAKSLGVKGVSTLRKAELAEAINEYIKAESGSKEATESVTAKQKRPEFKTSIDPELYDQYLNRKDERESKYSDLYNDDKEEASLSEDNMQYRRPRNNYNNPQAEGRLKSYYGNASTEPQARQIRPGVSEGRTAYRYNQNSENEARVANNSGEEREGVLEMVDGFGFLRCTNYQPSDQDVYISPSQIRKFNLQTGDMIKGILKIKSPTEKFQGLYSITEVNGRDPFLATKRTKFDNLTPVFPKEKIVLETEKGPAAMRLIDLLSPIGKGQRGMIVSQPKAGKTTLLKQVANAITRNTPDIKIIILLIDERPEEVTDIKESIEGKNVEVIYSTFDETPQNHIKVAEMVMERAKRLVEHGDDVCILLDSITRLARAYNLTTTSSGRTLSGGLDPSALHMPKKFFGAARCAREGGSLTILATALVETGSRMDDVVFEEFKGTGNMELVLDRSLSEKRIFPAIDLPKSGTRREDLLLTSEELEANYLCRNALNGAKSYEAIESILNMLRSTKNNAELVDVIRHRGIFKL